MKDVLSYLKKLITVDNTIIMATSGGPDSMCLLHLLSEVKKEKNFTIVVAHVNHKLRIESEEEAKFVEAFCKKENLPFEYMEIKEYGHDNLENEARQKRYEFFRALILKYQANYLMTAHHGDDLIETIMMRLVRGSSLKGYSGFSKVVNMNNYKIIRPLITKTKEEIMEYMDQNKFKYYLDASNLSRKYTRNRYRAELLPFLKKENKNVHLKFLKFSEELEETSNFLNEYIKNLLQDMKDKNGIEVKKLMKLEPFLVKKIIEYEFRLIYTNDLFLIHDNHTEEILKLLKRNKNGMIKLPNNYQAVIEYNHFRIIPTKEITEYDFLLDREIKTPLGVIKKIEKSDNNSNYIIRLNSKDIELPIHVRNRRIGDKIEVKNLNGTKKVKDILINEKIPKAKREVLPIVCDNKNTILWVPGIKKSKFDVKNNEIYDIILLYEEENYEY